MKKFSEISLFKLQFLKRFFSISILLMALSGGKVYASFPPLMMAQLAQIAAAYIAYGGLPVGDIGHYARSNALINGIGGSVDIAATKLDPGFASAILPDNLLMQLSDTRKVLGTPNLGTILSISEAMNNPRVDMRIPANSLATYLFKLMSGVGDNFKDPFSRDFLVPSGGRNLLNLIGGYSLETPILKDLRPTSVLDELFKIDDSVNRKYDPLAIYILEESGGFLNFKKPLLPRARVSEPYIFMKILLNGTNVISSFNQIPAIFMNELEQYLFMYYQTHGKYYQQDITNLYFFYKNYQWTSSIISLAMSNYESMFMQYVNLYEKKASVMGLLNYNLGLGASAVGEPSEYGILSGIQVYNELVHNILTGFNNLRSLSMNMLNMKLAIDLQKVDERSLKVAYSRKIMSGEPLNLSIPAIDQSVIVVAAGRDTIKNVLSNMRY